MTYGVRVERNRLRFAAAHMATFRGECEPLHGHNYQLLLEAEGDLTDDSWVIDFATLRRIARDRCDALDHTLLLQRDSRLLQLEESPRSWRVSIGERAYEFPKSDVTLLPLDNSTAERLAEWFHTEIAVALRAASGHAIRSLRVEVEEAPGQSGWFSAPLG